MFAHSMRIGSQCIPHCAQRPVVVGNRVYVGSWDGNFYAIDKGSGTQVWKFAIKPQPAVIPREDANGRMLDPADPASPTHR